MIFYGYGSSVILIFNCVVLHDVSEPSLALETIVFRNVEYRLLEKLLGTGRIWPRVSRVPSFECNPLPPIIGIWWVPVKTRSLANEFVQVKET